MAGQPEEEACASQHLHLASSQGGRGVAGLGRPAVAIVSGRLRSYKVLPAQALWFLGRTTRLQLHGDRVPVLAFPGPQLPTPRALQGWTGSPADLSIWRAGGQGQQDLSSGASL